MSESKLKLTAVVVCPFRAKEALVASSCENVKLTFAKDALKSIAKKAIKRKTGARGLRSIMEEILLDSMYEIPSEGNINEVVINNDVISGKSKPIIAYSKENSEVETSA